MRTEKIKIHCLNEKKKNTCGSCVHTDNDLGFIALHCDELHGKKRTGLYDDGKVRSWDKCAFILSRYKRRKNVK